MNKYLANGAKAAVGAIAGVLVTTLLAHIAGKVTHAEMPEVQLEPADASRYIYPITLAVSATDAEVSDLIAERLSAMADHVREFSLRELRELKRVRSEQGRTYDPFEVSMTLAELAALTAVTNIGCIALAQLAARAIQDARADDLASLTGGTWKGVDADNLPKPAA
jgi:hypothetical protein